ncbi:MAG: ABC transporter ATP-binding protein [Victivallales bacterium]|nr:ABC transporter ATP-binding protein [Victivallales bacterium]
MGRKHHKLELERPKQSTFRIFWRLMRGYALRYPVYLTLGLLSAVVMGGSLGMAFRMMSTSVDLFEAGTAPSTGQNAPNMHLSEPGENSIQVIDNQQVKTIVKESEAKSVLASREERHKDKSAKLLGQVNRILAFFHVEPVDNASVLDLKTVAILLSVIVLLFGLKALGEWLNHYSLRYVGARVVVDLRQELIDHLMTQSMGYFANGSTGALISRCTNDVAAIEHVVSQALPELCQAPVLIVVSLEFVVAQAISQGLGWQFLGIVVLLPFFIAPFYWLTRFLRSYQKQVLGELAQVTGRMQETFSGMMVIKAFRQETAEHERFKAVNESYFRQQKKAIMAGVLVHPLLQFVAIALCVVFVLLCYKFDVTLGSLAVIGFAAQTAYKPVKDLVKLYSNVIRCAAAGERVFEVLDLDTSLPQSANPVPISNFRDAIQYHDVSFSYVKGGAPVLSHIELTIPKGSLVALVGQTGSGKSTLANLLARFYDPTEGRITIDGTDLRDFETGQFRQQVGMVSQDTFLFNTTIAENIRYGRPEATDEEVRAAALQANALEFIEQFPEGFQHKVGERGNLLSGGQKQRIAIARAILRNPPILILDEATSALDTVTERLVQEALNNVMKDRTVIAIAHRLSTIQMASEILVMDQGRIIERGTHEQLLAADGAYAKLHAMQTN